MPTSDDPASGSCLRLALLVLAAIVTCLLVYGLGSGGAFYHRLVAAPFAPAAPAPYYRESLLHVGLAHLLGLGASLLAFRLFVLSFFWLGLVRLVAAAARRLSLADVARVLAVAVTHPAAMIAHAWTCHPDALTYGLTIALLFARRPALVAVLAFLGAWNHLPMWLIVCGDALVLWSGFAEPRLRPRALALLAGLLLGAVTCKLALHLGGIAIAEDRFAAAAGHPLPVLLGYWTGPGWPVLYTLYFAHLVWLPALLLGLHRTAPRAALGLVVTQALALAATFFTEDTTRVFAFLAGGPLLYALVHQLGVPAPQRPSALRPLVLAGVLLTLVAPKGFAWKGHLHDLQASRAHLRALLSR
ncbi:hypothetical protein SAMN02745121_04378 [Nannocystis exedens]|uniref:DUF2723 domain-containing protein n=1 Tax=Nannocystis exedens TaxID=54 RepID=A0A1I2AU64_9BACT|nr:hypothetical protein [Nannocystis exedens]PCC74275.1 hypothetical protein NAEX_07364 [Nannocystis exedens]SFE47452.1 hypothetical protein SAMN02745121_04378 [Nannocystis exedens]